jgi:hypothetical protein
VKQAGGLADLDEVSVRTHSAGGGREPLGVQLDAEPRALLARPAAAVAGFDGAYQQVSGRHLVTLTG